MIITKFTILGERCSGTNYLEQLIKLNFGLELTWEFGFKHFFYPRDYIDSGNVLFIGIIRNPVSWIKSLYQNPYHLNADLMQNKFNYLNHEFWSLMGDVTHCTTERLADRNYETGNRYKNIFELRKLKLKYLTEKMYKNVENYVLIRYEDLVNNLDNILTMLKENFKLIPQSGYPVFLEHIPRHYVSPISDDEILNHPDLSYETEIKVGYLLKEYCIKQIPKKNTNRSFGDIFIEKLKEKNIEDVTLLRFNNLMADICYGPDICQMRTNFYKFKISKILKNIDTEFDFFVSIQDNCYLDEELQEFVKDKIYILNADIFKNYDTIFSLIPDFYILSSNFGSIPKIKFQDKIPIAKFIGAPTGVFWSFESRHTQSRILACLESKKYPDLIDCKLTSNEAFDIKMQQYLIDTLDLPSPPENYSSLARYKYLLSFDGNASTWKRIEMIMHLYSVPMIQTKFLKFWSKFLVPLDFNNINLNANCVEIFDDVSNLKDCVLFLNNNKLIAEHIAINAQYLANTIFTDEFMEYYFTQVIFTCATP